MCSKVTTVICKDISKALGVSTHTSGIKLTFYLIVDFLFTQTVINLFSTASWRGVWNLLDHLFSPFKVQKTIVTIFSMSYDDIGKSLH